jgi:uncharacterized membrane protein YcaP (DUF421 family)
MGIGQALPQWLGIGIEAKDLSMLQVSLRGVIVFVVAIVLVRVANRRFLAKMSPFDVILGFMLASMLARAINGSGPFLPSLVGAFVLIMLHRFFAALAFRYHVFGTLVKGNAEVLVDEGKAKSDPMRRYRISERDLQEEMRINGNIEDLKDVQKAVIERNGQISVVKRR